jgi:hypothetical protein
MVLFTSCDDQKNLNSSSVSSDDIETAFEQILAFHDSIVKTNTPGMTKIDEAYMHYLDSVCPLILKEGDFSRSGVDADLRKKLFRKLDESSLNEIFIVGDTLEYFSMDVKRRVKRYFPYLVRMNNDGAYADLLKQLSKDNDFIDKYFTSWMLAGDLSPSCYGMVLRDYHKLNFSNPDHRLLYTVTILRVNEKIADRFVH